MEKKPAASISITEFLQVWHRFKTAIDLLVLKNGYEALTASNLCKLTDLPESAIATYFGSLNMLLQMHEHDMVMNQFLKSDREAKS